MKNTGITYTSAERSPVILPEMAELLPPLSAEQSAALEEDLLRNGCYSPIIVNEDMVIVDGHNRQALCEKHGLPYTMAVFSFEDLLEAKQWALDTQKGRRNLEKWELGKIALKLKPEIEAKARANQGTRTDLSATLPEGSDTVDTRKELAEAVGLGERTMGKVMQIDENAPEVIKEALDKKELSINKGYDLTRQLQDLPEEQREQAAAEALEYEKAKKELKKQDAEIDRKGKIAALFCKAYEKAVLLTPSEENVRCWTDGTRMTPEEMQDTVKESRELAEVFRTIADIIEQKICPRIGGVPMQKAKKTMPSRTGIPPDAQAEILQKLSAETKITSCEIAEILKKHDVCGDMDALQDAYRKRLGQRLLSGIRDENGKREILSTSGGEYVIVDCCNDPQKLKAIQRRIQAQMNGLDVSAGKVHGRVHFLERFMGWVRKERSDGAA